MVPVASPAPMADPTTTRPPHKPWYAQLYLQVLAAILLGVLLAHFYAQTGEVMKPIGYPFIKLVKMIIASVIFLTIVMAIAGMRDLGSLGRVATNAFAYFLFFSTLALFVANLFGRANMRW